MAAVLPVAVQTHRPDDHTLKLKCSIASRPEPSRKPIRNLLTAAGLGCEISTSFRAGGNFVSVNVLLTTVCILRLTRSWVSYHMMAESGGKGLRRPVRTLFVGMARPHGTRPLVSTQRALPYYTYKAHHSCGG
jgi:hypothetical protein